jgi:basic membrane protein A
MKKNLFTLLSALAILSLALAACATPAPAAPTAMPAKAFRIGLVTDVGKVDDKSFNQSAWEGAQCGAKETGGTTKYIETTDPKDYDKNIAQFGDEGYDVIVTVGFALGEATIKNAAKYTKAKFIGVDQFQEKPTAGVGGLIFPEDEAGFQAGVVAAMMSKSGQIGAVLGTDVVPPVWRFGEGYRAGAVWAKKDTKVNIVYHNDVGFDKTFTDPEWGKTTALSMIDKGADVIFGAGGKTGNGALLGVAQSGKALAIGVDTDQYLTVPEAKAVLLTSAMKLIVPGTCDMIKAAKAGTFKDGNIVGKVGLAPYHDTESKVTAEAKAKLDEALKGLAAGSLKTNVAPVKPAK